MRSTFLMLAVLLATAAPAFSAEQPVTEAEKRACRGDVAKLCKGVQGGEKGLRECMEKQCDKVSAACRDVMTKRGAC